MVKTYCLKERKLTENINPKIIKIRNNKMDRSKCTSCSLNNARFIKIPV